MRVMSYKIISLIWVPLLFAACATEQPVLPRPLNLPQKVEEFSSFSEPVTANKTVTQVTETPKPPAGKAETIKNTPAVPSAPEGAADISLALEQVPLTTFIQVVYSEILKKNVNIDPGVMSRQDLVTIRTGTPQSPKQVEDSAIMLLKSYGIAVMDLGGITRIVPDNANLGYLPEIRRGRALPETPLPLRPIFQLVELQAVRNTDIASWMNTMFGSKVKLVEDPNRNAVWLSGQASDVTAALEAIHVLDQPLMRGRHSRRIAPAFMSADDLAKKLTEILQAEGYSAGPPTAIVMPVVLVPVTQVNSLIVFALDEAILDHVVAWANDLDKRNEQMPGRSLFSYQVKTTDAQALANTLERVLGGQVAAAPAPGDKNAVAAQRRVVVDAGSNTIIFQGVGEDYGQIRGLLEMLDKPSKEALIEVTVAEVALDENSQLGVEWLLKGAGLNNYHMTAGTLGGLGVGSAGFTYKLLDNAAQTRLVINALASNNRATILSSPRIMARNGEQATIQVGQEVPIITSQQTSPTTGSTGSVLQTVQYRSTGVILNVKPIIHSGNQIDLEINQEVSSAQATNTGVNTSPTFGTRKLQTKLSLKDGATILLGGLISNNGSTGEAGIPLLKDIPGVGQLFRTNTAKKSRTELIILITPYIISTDSEAQEVTDAFKSQLGKWAQTPQKEQEKESHE